MTNSTAKSHVEICVKDDTAILYQLESLSHNLCSLCAIWEPAVRSIPCMDEDPQSWGPSDPEIWSMQIANDGIATGQDWTIDSSEEIASEDSDTDRCASEENDDDLLEAIEATELADAHYEDNADDDMIILGENISVNFSMSPQKRHYREDSIE